MKKKQTRGAAPKVAVPNSSNPNVKTSVQEITPELAQFYLDFNTEHNRPVSLRHVAFLAREMREGRWKTNGDAIRIDREGRLIDGQHRLRAVIESGVTIRSVVVDNLEPEAFHTIDQGHKSRNAADLLAIGKEASPRYLSSALRFIWRYEHGFFPNQPYPASSQELLATLTKFPLVREAVAKVYNSGGGRGGYLTNTSGVLLWFYPGRKHEMAVQQFWDAMNSGANIQPKTGLCALRERLIKQRTQTAQLSSEDTLALLIKAWNCDFQGKTMRQLAWRSDEPFPKFLS